MNPVLLQIKKLATARTLLAQAQRVEAEEFHKLEVMMGNADSPSSPPGPVLKKRISKKQARIDRIQREYSWARPKHSN